MKRVLTALLFVLLLAAPAAAQKMVEVPSPVISAIVVVQNCTGSECLHATGTLVAKGNGRGLILTTGHLFDIGRGKLSISLPGDRRYEGTLLETNRQLDLSVIEISEPPASPLAIAAADPVIGSAVKSLGYGPGRLCCNEGRGLGYLSDGCFEISGAAWQGDSGGPMLDERWEVCGVIKSTNGRVVDGVACRAVRSFVDRFRSRCGNRPAAPPRVPPSSAQAPPYSSHAPTPPQVTPPQPIPPATEPIAPPDAGSAAGATPPGQMTQKERDELEQQHAAAMNAKAAELDKLQAQLAAEHAATEKALAQLAAQEATCAGASISGRVTGDGAGPILPSDPLAPAGDVADAAAQLGTSLLTKLLVSFGVPGGAAAVGAGIGMWFMRRRLLQRASATSSTSDSTANSTANPAGDSTTQHHNVFSYVPIDKFDRAWSTAVARCTEKFPGQAKALEQLVRVKDQILKGEPTDGAKS